MLTTLKRQSNDYNDDYNGDATASMVSLSLTMLHLFYFLMTQHCHLHNVHVPVCWLSLPVDYCFHSFKFQPYPQCDSHLLHGCCCYVTAQTTADDGVAIHCQLIVDFE